MARTVIPAQSFETLISRLFRDTVGWGGRRASPSSRPIKRRDPTNYGGLSAQRRVAATAAASAGQGRLAAGASPLQSQPRRCRRFLSKFTAGLAVGCGFLWGADPVSPARVMGPLVCHEYGTGSF